MKPSLNYIFLSVMEIFFLPWNWLRPSRVPKTFLLSSFRSNSRYSMEFIKFNKEPLCGKSLRRRAPPTLLCRTCWWSRMSSVETFFDNAPDEVISNGQGYQPPRQSSRYLFFNSCPITFAPIFLLHQGSFVEVLVEESWIFIWSVSIPLSV